MTQGKFRGVCRQAFVTAAKPAHRLTASGNTEIAKLQPGALCLDEIRPDRANAFRMLGGHFEPDHGVVAVHGIAAYDSRGRIVPDSDGHVFLLFGFLWNGEMLLTCRTGMSLYHE